MNQLIEDLKAAADELEAAASTLRRSCLPGFGSQSCEDTLAHAATLRTHAAQLAASEQAGGEAALCPTARWRKIETLWFLGDVELSTDENGQFLINIDPAEHAAQGWSGIDQGAAIDAALAANAPETRP